MCCIVFAYSKEEIMPVHKGIKLAAQNKKARHDYFIEDTLECGVALVGTEVNPFAKGH